MAKYHITPRGEVKQCNAKVQPSLWRLQPSL